MRTVRSARTALRALFGLSLVVLGTLGILPGLLRAADDNLQSARERMEMRSYEDAFRFIKLELATDAESWKGYYYLGEYYLRGYSQKKEALSAYLKSWRFTQSHLNSALSDRETYSSLVEQLTNLIQEKVTATGGAGGTKILEQAILRENFPSVPLILSLFQQYNSNSNWTGILEAAEALKKFPEGALLLPKGETDLGWVAYYSARAYQNQGDLRNAYTQYQNAAHRGVLEAKNELPEIQLKVEEAALPLLQSAKAAYDANPPNYLQAGVLYQNLLTKVPQGTKTYEKAKQGVANCEAAVAIDLALKAIEASRQKGDYQSAMARLNDALARYPSDPRLRARQVELEQLQDKISRQLTQVEEDKNRSEKEKHGTYVQLIAEGQHLRVARKYMEACQAFQKALRIERSHEVEDLLKDTQKEYDQLDHFEQAQALMKKRDYSGALKLLSPLLEDDPNYSHGTIKKMVAICYFETHNMRQALSIAEPYLDHQEDPDLLLRLANYHEANKESRLDMKKALGYLERLQRLNPGDAELDARVTALSWELNKMTYVGLGFVLLVWLTSYVLVRKKPELTKKVNLTDLERFMNKKDYRSAADLHPQIIGSSLTEKEEIQVRTLFARAFFETREHSKCINECQVVLRLLPDNKQIRVLMARSLYSTKTIAPDTLPFYMDYIEVDSQNRELIAYVGNFCIKKRLINNTTMPLLRTLATLNPDDDKLRDLLIKGYVKDNDRTAIAMTLYEVEVRKNPKNLEVRAILAEEYLRKGDVTKAIQECEEIINIDLNQPRTHKVLAAAYTKLGKIDQLIAIYQSILESDPHNGTIQTFLGKVIAGINSPERSGVLGRSGVEDRSSGIALRPPAGEKSGAADRSLHGEKSGIVVRTSPGEQSAALARSGIAERPSTRPPVEPGGKGPFSADLPDAPEPSAERSQAASRSAALGRSAIAKRARPGAESAPDLFNPSGDMEGAQPPPAEKPSGISCPKCGKPVPVGTYFCECGQML